MDEETAVKIPRLPGESAKSSVVIKTEFRPTFPSTTVETWMNAIFAGRGAGTAGPQWKVFRGHASMPVSKDNDQTPFCSDNTSETHTDESLGLH